MGLANADMPDFSRLGNPTGNAYPRLKKNLSRVSQILAKSDEIITIA
jgi:hypothetical protein